MHSSPALKLRISRGQPKARVSISSEITPQAMLDLTNSVHCAQAQEGDYTTGSPINLIILMASAFSALVMRTLLWDCLRRSNTSPYYMASCIFYYAFYLSCFRLLSSEYFSSGGWPSKTQIVFMLFCRQKLTRESMPIRWPVWLPIQSVGVEILPFLTSITVREFTLSFDEELIYPVRCIQGKDLVRIILGLGEFKRFREAFLYEIHQFQDAHLFLLVPQIGRI